MDEDQPEPNVPPREKDPGASPLGRGADPGAVDGTAPLTGTGSIAGQRGHAPPAQRGGPEGFLDRENEDMMQQRRDAAPGSDAEDNDPA